MLNDGKPAGGSSQKSGSSLGDQFDLFSKVVPGNAAEKPQPSSKNKDFELFVSGFQKPLDNPASQSDFNFF